MFIIAGESESEKKLGVVADKCLICGQVTVLRVTQIQGRPHIYLILPAWQNRLPRTHLQRLRRESDGRTSRIRTVPDRKTSQDNERRGDTDRPTRLWPKRLPTGMRFEIAECEGRAQPPEVPDLAFNWHSCGWRIFGPR